MVAKTTRTARDSSCKAYNYRKVAGDNFWINISAIPRMQQCSINIVSLNEHMALNLNEYICSLNEHISSNGYNFPEWICFIERGYIFLNELTRFLGTNIISCQNLIASNDYTFLSINICSLNKSVFSWQLTSISFPLSWINAIPWSCINLQLLDVK